MPYLDFKNKKIYYRVEGKGKPILFLHGFGEDGSVWEPQIEKFKKDFQVIVPDLPRSGQSEMLEGAGTLEDYAEVVNKIAAVEIMGRQGESSFSLIGHSMGGYIALVFAQKYGHLLNSFGLFHSSALADDPEKIVTRKKSLEFITKNGVENYFRSSVPNLFSEESQNNKKGLITKLIELAGNLSEEVIVQYTLAMINRKDTTQVLKAFTKPVLFIIGIHDKAVPLEASLKQCHLPGSNSVHFLQHSGHLGMWEEEDLSNTYLQHFFNGFVYPREIIK